MSVHEELVCLHRIIHFTFFACSAFLRFPGRRLTRNFRICCSPILHTLQRDFVHSPSILFQTTPWSAFLASFLCLYPLFSSRSNSLVQSISTFPPTSGWEESENLVLDSDWLSPCDCGISERGLSQHQFPFTSSNRPTSVS